MKAKKVLAMLMASAMIMGTSVTAFAATPTNIIVNNVDAGAELSYLQIIEPDTTAASGWKFVDPTIAQVYKKGFNSATQSSYDEETIIWMLIKNADENAKVPDTITTPATADQIQEGVAAVLNAREEGGVLENYDWTNMTIVGGNQASAEVNEAGIYVIDAVDTDNFTYSPMAAYVSFDSYDTTTGVPSDLTSEAINAKKTTVYIDKKNSEGENDKIVAVGDTITYTVDTVVPYFEANIDDASLKYTITDTIIGAVYDMENNNQLHVTVKLDGNIVQENGNDYWTVNVTDTTKDGKPAKTFTIDLSSIAKNRDNANKTLEISYDAVVKDLEVSNEVSFSRDGILQDDDDDKLYTGVVTLTKFGEADEDPETETPGLKGAEFLLYYTQDDETYYATFVKDEEGNPEMTNDGAYQVESWTTEKTDADRVVTGDDGVAKVAGLDNDEDTYYFEEVKAPDGYSINENDAVVEEWKVTTSGDTTTATATAEMYDTKLSSLPLPSTGGIGTTLFTVGGCTIMVAAAGLYFATRKKEQN